MAAPSESTTKDIESPKFLLTFAAGLNENQTPHIHEASAGFNFELGARQTKLIPRVPYDLEGTAPNGLPVTGIMQMVTRAAVKTTLVAAGGSVYKWDGATFTVVGAVTAPALLRDSYWSLQEFLAITDVSLNNVVKKWDGTTLSDMPTALPNPFYAKYSVVYLGRMWYFNVISVTATPHLMLASTFEDPQTLNLTNRGGATTNGGGTFATGLEPFYLLTPDLKPINGVSVFQNLLVISTTDGMLFKLTGTSAKDFAFVPFYVGSAAVGTEAIQNIGNDVIYMKKGGNVNLLSSTQNYGDVRSNDVSRWIPNTVADIKNSLIIYDQTLQKVYFFVTGKVLVMFKDILFGGGVDQVNSGLSPWSVYTTMHPNAFNAQAAKYMQHPTTDNGYSVYWGDANGNLFDMNGTGIGGDAGVYTIDCKRKSRIIDLEVINPFPYTENIMLGKVQFRRKLNTSQLSLAFDWSDEFNTSFSVVNLKGGNIAGGSAGYFNRASYFGAGSYFGAPVQTFSDAISHQVFSPTGKGPGFYLTLESQSKYPWQVDHVEFY